MERILSLKINDGFSYLHQLRAKHFLLFALFISSLSLGLWLPSKLTVSISPSLQHRIFWLAPYEEQSVTTGDYLVFHHAPASFTYKGLSKGNKLHIKQVGCSPGEQLTHTATRHYSCGSQQLGEILLEDSEGNQLPQFGFNGEVPQGSYFMTGSHPRSFDSRYYGFIHENDIKHKAIPLW